MDELFVIRLCVLAFIISSIILGFAYAFGANVPNWLIHWQLRGRRRATGFIALAMVGFLYIVADLFFDLPFFDLIDPRSGVLQ